MTRLSRAALASLLISAACGKGDPGTLDTAAMSPTPPVHKEGERLFNENCASCHGSKGTGTQQGPPLVHVIYEPGHHSDAAFLMAVQRGVVAHHWRFGNMAPLPAVSSEQTMLITSYVRWLQRQAGIR